MNRNKWIAGIMLVLLSFSLVACGHQAEETSGNSAEAAVSASSEVTSATSTEEGAEASAEPISEVNVSCQYTAADTHGANQFAVWVENEAGEMVCTVFVTDFTAGRRGYREREMSLSAWVASADPENMSDEVIDAISSATPGSGALTFSWDMCDAEGNRVPDGQYTLKFESNFYMESDVLYTALIDTTATPAGTVELQEVRSMPDDLTNENMITEVSVEVVR